MEDGIGSGSGDAVGSAEGTVGNESSVGDLAAIGAAVAGIAAGGFVGGSTGAAMGAIGASQNGNVQSAAGHLGADVVNGASVTGELAAANPGAFGLFEAASVSASDFASSDGGAAGAGITYGAGPADLYAAWGSYEAYTRIYGLSGLGGGSEGGGY